MRKVIFTILAVLTLAFMLPSCSTSDSLEETLQEVPTEEYSNNTENTNRKPPRH